MLRCSDAKMPGCQDARLNVWKKTAKRWIIGRVYRCVEKEFIWR
jgi:hypothetical protein